MKKLAVALMSLVTAFAGIPPAEAFPVVNFEKPKVVSNIEQVQDRRLIIRRWNGRRYYPGYRNYGSYRYRNYGGYRYRNYGGYRYRNYDGYYGRRYYRHRNNDAAAIIGGLALGAIIGGALAQPRYYAPAGYNGGNAHTRWCYNQYRSYRAWDNTFQPYYGPRRQCVSPY
ncbi:BA14K family protein [Rhizobium sullae]|uniref:Lectin-like protein BA14k n=1 Tax=Rhizobium sullae TaxID=50338 RepID=A0A2N0D6H0_RHISU|nr:BA14K family protein [Rhizobium sullae]PKA41708.1 BA14K family protein [Rhizobium sullae]UWU13414.1 BA14K family protein [Rhizobium sullae]